MSQQYFGRLPGPEWAYEDFQYFFTFFECFLEHFAAYLWFNAVEFIKNMLGKPKFDANLSLKGFLHILGPVTSIKVAKILVFH